MRFLRFLLIRFVGIIVGLAFLIAISQTVMFFSSNGEYPQMVQNHQPGVFSALVSSIVTDERAMFTLNFPFRMSAFANAFLVSLMLTVGAIVIAAIFGIPLGLIAAVKKRYWFAHIGSVGGLVAQGVPPISMAIVLQLIFAVFWRVLPLNGWYWNNPTYWVLPMLALALTTIGYVAKFMQTGMNEALTQDFMTSAKARGLPGWKLVMRHAFRPALVSVVTVFGPQMAMIVMGTVIVEEIFQTPGLGGLLGYSININTGTVGELGTQGGMLAIASIFVLGVLVMVLNLIVDMTYRALDPRIKW